MRQRVARHSQRLTNARATGSYKELCFKLDPAVEQVLPPLPPLSHPLCQSLNHDDALARNFMLIC